MLSKDQTKMAIDMIDFFKILFYVMQAIRHT